MPEHSARLVFLAKHGPEHPEKATLTVAMATDLEAMVIREAAKVISS